MMTKAAAERLLGLKKEWTDEERRQAWKRKASEHHPDKGGSVAKFCEVNQANDTLVAYAKQPTICPECRGLGKLIKVDGFFSHGTRCGACNGQGKVSS